MSKPPRPPTLTKDQIALWDKREEILYTKDGHLRVTKADFNWFDVTLANGLCKIQVTYPLMMKHPVDQQNYYVPVTASETWEIARLLGFYPLTSHVFDATFLLAMTNNVIVTPGYMTAANTKECYDFPKATRCLQRYSAVQGQKAAGGGHKLWILSAAGNSVNRGFYQPNSKKPNGFSVIQAFGTGHNAHHWDYSQLLQLMTNFTDGGGGTIDMIGALKQTPPNAALWDEATALSAQQISNLPAVAKKP